MRRILVLLTLAVGLGAIGLVACGGNDKPPLTPDTVEPPPDGQLDAAAPGTPTAPTAPAK
jgi:hypothetical protein